MENGTLAKNLETLGLTVKVSYGRAEVCSILGISTRTFWSMTNGFEPNAETGLPKNPATLDSFMLRGQRRVTHTELESFIARNRTYTRQCADTDTFMK